MMRMCDGLLLTIADAAQRLSIGRSMLYTLIQRGELPSVKLGGARRVLLADLEAFVTRLRDQYDEQQP